MKSDCIFSAALAVVKIGCILDKHPTDMKKFTKEP